MSELLLELRTGGLPPSSLAGLTLRLKNSLIRSLRESEVGPRQSSTSFTGRRVMILLRGLPDQERGSEAVLGPAVAAGLDERGEATPELQAFLEAHGIGVEDLQTETREGEEFLVWYAPTGPGREETIAAAVAQGIAGLELPEPMRWGRDRGPWFRPIEGILALLDGETLPLEVLGVKATNTTVGHPVLSPKAVPVRSVEHYGQLLAEFGIEPRFADRRSALLERFETLARDEGGLPQGTGPLLDRLAAGCECPTGILGRFDSSFLTLPKELLVTALGELRQVIAVRNSEGELLPCFLAVIDRPDDPRGRIRFGFEWAVGGLLRGLRDLHDRDRLVPLAQRVGTDAAEEVTRRAARLGRLASSLAHDLGESSGVSPDIVSEAASLLDADRSTHIVRALPTLRGVYGGLLARSEGYPDSVWQAIYECGQVRGETLPESQPGRLVLLAEHLDTLVSLAELDELPSVPERAGVDRYGARALSRRVVRALSSDSLGLDLHRVVTRAIAARPELSGRAPELARSLCQLLDEGLLAVLGADGYSESTLRAILDSPAGGRQVSTVRHRVSVLHSLRTAPELEDLVKTATRLVDLLLESTEASIDVRMLTEEAEKDLFVLLSRLKPGLEEAMSVDDAKRWLGLMCELNDGVERFFSEVLIRDGIDSLRENRLALIQAVHRAYSTPLRLAALGA
ncbi:MAG: glycine--tRNA ligase subunit beta [Acidobacteriota bacterium]